MKIFFVLLLSWPVLNGKSQVLNHKTTDVSVSYGFPSLVSLATKQDLDKSFLSPFGPVIINVSGQLNRHISVGAEVAYSKASSKLVNDASSGMQYRYKLNLLTGLVRFDYLYQGTGAFKLYSGLGVGITRLGAKAKLYTGSGTPPEDKDAGTQFGFQVTAIGFKYYGAGRLGLKGELGFGYNGVVSAGILYRLNSPSD